MTINVDEVKSVFSDGPSVFTSFNVDAQFLGRVAGSIPGEPFPILEMVQRKLMKQGGISRDEIDKKEVEVRTKMYLQEIGKDVEDASPDTITELAARTIAATTNVFRRDEVGIYIPSHSFKAALKECVNILYAKEKWGPTFKGPMNYLVERVFIRPDHIHLYRDGKPLQEADDIQILRGVVQNKMGQQSIVTQHEYVECPNVSFTIQVLNYEAKGKDDASAGKSAEQELENRWKAIFQLMEQNGVGSHRKQSGYGVFAVTKFERVGGSRKSEKAAKAA